MEWCLWMYRQLYWCKRRLCPGEVAPKRIFVNTSNLPWFWIGIKHSAESCITVTDIVNCSLEYGIRVTPEYLSKVTGFKDGNWKYVDSETLEEKDFPSDGFIIEDVFDKQLSDSE
jgi:lysozyme family protein